MHNLKLHTTSSCKSQHTTHCWLKMRYGTLLGAAGRLPINNAAFWLYIQYKLAAPGSCRKHDVLAALKISIDELIGVLKLMKWYWNVLYIVRKIQFSGKKCSKNWCMWPKNKKTSQMSEVRIYMQNVMLEAVGSDKNSFPLKRVLTLFPYLSLCS